MAHKDVHTTTTHIFPGTVDTAGAISMANAASKIVTTGNTLSSSIPEVPLHGTVDVPRRNDDGRSTVQGTLAISGAGRNARARARDRTVALPYVGT